MKNLKLISLIVLLAAAGFAQTAMSSTTLSSAVAISPPGSAPTFIIVASATNIQAPSASAPGSILFVDSEAMRVTAVNGTSIGVVRGTDGTRSTGHLSGVVVWFATPGSIVMPADGFLDHDPKGACVVANTFTPSFNLLTGEKFACGLTALSTTGNGIWSSMGPFNSRPIVGKAIASATTIAPQLGITHITGTTAIVNITVPPACPDTGCQITLIFDGVASWTAAGNIAVVSSTVVAKVAVIFVYDPVTALWYPTNQA